MVDDEVTGEMKHQVVVADDEGENCRVLSELLAAEGFDPLPFDGGEAVWSAMVNGQIRPDAVVLDVRMPGLSGVDLLRRIKARFPSIPVVLVSAFADEQVWLEGLEAGAADVFPKPIHGASLVGALRAAVCRGQAHGLPVGENPGPQPAGITERRSNT